MSHKIAAEDCGMDRQTLRDWVHRYNAEGVEGLSNRGGGGVRPRLSPDQMAQLAAWVEPGLDPVTVWCAGAEPILCAVLRSNLASSSMSARLASIWASRAFGAFPSVPNTPIPPRRHR
ncbi:MAG: helix-turn-helix domain-containing protein [Rhodobacteraceae bacterium]|nr:helix-turn-helix domain-containing protein [Paracoccaceae bacterium]